MMQNWEKVQGCQDGGDEGGEIQIAQGNKGASLTVLQESKGK